MSELVYRKIIESPYGRHPDNFHVVRRNNELEVTLTYPPWTDVDNKLGQVRHIRIDQESVRASDGIRVHYDYNRDGVAVEQPKVTYVPVGDDQMNVVEEWIEVGFFPSWRFDGAGHE